MDVLLSDGASIRSLSRIAHTAAKLSEFIQITPTPPSLTLRVLNASQTTFASFRLHQPFFSQHHLSPSSGPYKLPTRALLPPLRSPAAISSLRLRAVVDALQLVVHSRSGVCKHFRLPVVHGRVSTVSAAQPSYTLRCSARLFLDILLNFHLKLDEITLLPTADALRLSSFVDHDPSHLILRTEMTVSSAELEQYSCPPDQPSLTIACRSLRTALDFCDPFDSAITIAFTQPGQPLLLTFDHRNLDNLLLFHARFVFATRHEHSSDALHSRRAPTQLPAEHHPAPESVPPSHSHHQTTSSIRQPIASHPLHAPSSHPVHTHSHQSPSSPYVSASQPHSKQHASVNSHHPSAPVLVPHDASVPPASDLFANYPALSDSLAQQPTDDQDDDEYVDATPPP